MNLSDILWQPVWHGWQNRMVSIATSSKNSHKGVIQPFTYSLLLLLRLCLLLRLLLRLLSFSLELLLLVQRKRSDFLFQSVCQNCQGSSDHIPWSFMKPPKPEAYRHYITLQTLRDPALPAMLCTCSMSCRIRSIQLATCILDNR